MPDREEVIKGLRELHGSFETMKLISEAIVLLKEKQSKSPTWRREKAFCGGCGRCLENKEQHSSDIVQSIRFCKWCGVPVDWSNE